MTKNQAWEEFLDECGEEEPDVETAWYAGWGACAKELKKLQEKYDELEWRMDGLEK